MSLEDGRRNNLKWCRLWADILDSPRLGRLSDATYRTWVGILAYCSREGYGDTIADSPADLAWALRRPEPEVVAALAEMATVGLIVVVPEGYRLQGWVDRQPLSDCDPTGAERQRRWRESRTAKQTVTDTSRVTSEPVTGTDSDSDSDSDSEKTQTQRRTVDLEVGGPGGETSAATPSQAKAPTPTPTEPKTTRKKPARTLPPDWQPTDAHRALAAEQGVACDAEAVKMRDHAQATGRLLADWDAGFRTWLRRAREYGAQPTGGGGPPGYRPGKSRGEDPRLGAPSPATSLTWCSTCFTTHGPVCPRRAVNA